MEGRVEDQVRGVREREGDGGESGGLRGVRELGGWRGER